MAIDFCKNGYMHIYEVWVHHGEDPPPRIVPEVQSHEESYDRMEAMLDDVRHELLPVDSENPVNPPIMRILLRLRFRSSSSSLELQRAVARAHESDHRNTT
jgi:hypothetical protein